MQILIVEDDSTIRSGLKYCLESEGYKILEASNGEQALELSSTVNLILLDVNLPDINGFELLPQIKSKKDVPIFF